MRIAARVLAGWMATAAGAGGAWAQADTAASRPVYRCPGPPVEYTNELTPEVARERGCRIIEALPVTIVQPPPRPAPASGPVPAPAGAAAAAAPRPEARIDPAAQRARDADARRILEAELRKEEERLAVLRREFNNGEPERRGDERNYARYLERVEALRAAIARTEADVAAIRRELARLAP